MLIPTLYLIIAGQIAFILLCLVGYLIYMLVSEENRWEIYTDKLKNKIRELQEYKDRFDVISENLHKQMELTKELSEQVEQLQTSNDEKDLKIAELQKEIEILQSLKEQIKEKEDALNEINNAKGELQKQITLLEDQTTKTPEQISELNTTIEILESENSELKQDLHSANELVMQYLDESHSVSTDFNLEVGGEEKKQTAASQTIFNNIQSQLDQEVERLRKNYNNQKLIISDLETALMRVKDNPSEPLDIDDSVIPRFQQMLNESNTVIEMLEGEINTQQSEIEQLLAQNEALTIELQNVESGSSQKQQTEDGTVDDLNSINSENTVFTDDVFFEDGTSDGSKETVMNDHSKPIASDAELQQLQDLLDGANKMTMTMMSANGDQGNIISFARDSIQFKTREELAQGVLKTASLFQVNASLQVRGEEHTTFNVSSYGDISDADNNKISDMSNEERFEEDGQELLIRFPNLSLLIKDLPLNDPDKLGRIKDNMTIALELASAELTNLESEIKIKHNQKVLNQVLKNTYETIQNVEKQFNTQNEVTLQVVNSLTGIISNPAMTEGMDPIYKDVFTSIINDGKKQFEQIKSSGLAIDKDFAELVKRLGKNIN